VYPGTKGGGTNIGLRGKKVQGNSQVRKNRQGNRAATETRRGVKEIILLEEKGSSGLTKKGKSSLVVRFRGKKETTARRVNRERNSRGRNTRRKEGEQVTKEKKRQLLGDPNQPESAVHELKKSGDEKKRSHLGEGGKIGVSTNCARRKGEVPYQIKR